jgi:hypothetical protein
MIQLKPGLAKRLYRPKRSMSPRWVGRTIRMPDKKMTMTTAAIQK